MVIFQAYLLDHDFAVLFFFFQITPAERNFCFGVGHNQARSGKQSVQLEVFAAVRSSTQTTPAECFSEDGENGRAERWTEMQADGGGGLETINLTLTAQPLRNCIKAARVGICVCAHACFCYLIGFQYKHQRYGDQ